MKKFLSLILALLMVMSLVACGNTSDTEDTDSDSNTDATTTEDTTLVALDDSITGFSDAEPYRVLVQEGDPKGLLEGINAAIATLTTEKIQEIIDKVASQEVNTGDVADEIGGQTEAPTTDKPVLVMGTSPDYPPYEFYSDSAMTEFAGIDIEIAKYIADQMGYELQIETMMFDNLIASLANGDFDIVMAAIEKTDERDNAADFSDPYYTDAKPVILCTAANADKYTSIDDINKADVIIGAQKNTTKADLAAETFPEAANGMVLESLVPTLITELKNGTIDLLVLDGSVGANYVG